MSCPVARLSGGGVRILRGYTDRSPPAPVQLFSPTPVEPASRWGALRRVRLLHLPHRTSAPARRAPPRDISFLAAKSGSLPATPPPGGWRRPTRHRLVRFLTCPRSAAPVEPLCPSARACLPLGGRVDFSTRPDTATDSIRCRRWSPDVPAATAFSHVSIVVHRRLPSTSNPTLEVIACATHVPVAHRNPATTSSG